MDSITIFELQSPTKQQIIISTGITVFCLAMAAVCIGLYLRLTLNTGLKVTVLLIGILVAITPIVSFLLSPSKLHVVKNKLIVETKIKKFNYAFSSNVKNQIDNKILNNSTRTFGVGGLFGIYGKFRLANGTLADVWCTSTSGLLLVSDGHTTLVINPQQPDELIKHLNGR